MSIRSSIGQKLFKTYALTFLFSYVILFVFSVVFIQFFFGFDLNLFFLFTVIYFLAALVLAFWAAWRIAKPLIRITTKAQRISNRRLQKESFSAEDIFENEDEEFSELELALEKLNKNYHANQDLLNSERVEAEAIIGQIQEAVLITDEQGILRFYNQKFLEHFIAPDLRGQKIILQQIFRQPEVLNLFKSLTAENVLQRQEIEVRSQRDQSVRYFSVTLNLLKKGKDQNLSPRDILAVFYDITEIKKAEKVRIDFVSNASHELKTPLTSIKGYVETIRGDLREQRYSDLESFINIVAKNVDTLIELVQDLLNLSKLETFKEILKVQCDIQMISESLIQELKPEIDKKSIMLRMVFPESVIKADEKKLEQVLRNLLSNAVRYTPQGGEIFIATEKSQHGVVLKVKDNGTGIDPVHHARLFERFYRIDQGRSRDQGGTGLGLAIVKHIMLSHGGSVKVISAVGEGSEFICEFPN